MIDQVQRAHATAIAHGQNLNTVNDSVHDKAAIYGYMARFLAGTDLDAVRADSQKIKAKTIDGVMRKLGKSMTGAVERSYKAQPGVVRQADFYLRARASDRNEGVGGKPSLDGLYGGIETAMLMEAITLFTTQWQIENRGTAITPAGLLASQRVPFKLAMQHLAGLHGSTEVGMYTSGRLESGEFGTMLHSDMVTMSPETGLVIGDMTTNMGDMGHPEDPQIGCPATMVKGFIRQTHAIAAEAAARNGLISVIRY